MRLVQYEQTQTALGGSATFGLVLPEGFDADNLFAMLWKKTFRFERQFSRFLPESELSRLNAQAGIKVPISPDFQAILRTAQRLAVETNGLMNPFVLPAIQRSGYVHSALEQYAHDPAPNYSERSVVLAEQLEVGDDWARIPYRSAIDIGGFGKGYLADELGNLARERGARGYWINLSGDIALFGVTADGALMQVAVQPAYKHTDTTYLMSCPAEPCGVATSGTLRREGHETLASHHIVDPRTGIAAQTDILLASVLADSALQADVLASCAVILGSKQGKAFITKHSANALVLQLEDGSHVSAGSSIIKTEEKTHA